VTPSDPWKTGQGDRTSANLPNHLHDISPIPKVPIAEKKGK